MTEAKQLGRDLGLELEPVRMEVERTRQFEWHDLVPGLHVRQVAVVQDVGDQCDEAVAHDVPEAVRRVVRERARSVHDRGTLILEGCQERAEVAG